MLESELTSLRCPPRGNFSLKGMEAGDGMSALNPVRTSCELCWLLIQRSWEPPAPRMAYRNDRVHSGAKHWYLQCRRLRSVVKELDERRQEN